MSWVKFWVIAFFVLINNGCSLLGFADRSVGGVARNVESRSEIAGAAALLWAQKTRAVLVGSGLPAERAPQYSANGHSGSGSGQSASPSMELFV
ncbi:hypothetical protein ACYU03_21965 [Pseudomonas sp. X10]